MIVIRILSLPCKEASLVHSSSKSCHHNAATITVKKSSPNVLVIIDYPY